LFQPLSHQAANQGRHYNNGNIRRYPHACLSSCCDKFLIGNLKGEVKFVGFIIPAKFFSVNLPGDLIFSRLYRNLGIFML
jgi:hypothetical protein